MLSHSQGWASTAFQTQECPHKREHFAEAQKVQQRAGQWEAVEQRNKFLFSQAAVSRRHCPEMLCSAHLGGTENPEGHSNEQSVLSTSLPASVAVWLCDPWADLSAQAEVPGYTRNTHPGCKQTLPSVNAVDESLCLPWPWSCVISFGCEKAIIAPDNGKSQRWAAGTGNPISQAFKACLAQLLSAALSEITALKITPHNKLCI